MALTLLCDSDAQERTPMAVKTASFSSALKLPFSSRSFRMVAAFWYSMCSSSNLAWTLRAGCPVTLYLKMPEKRLRVMEEIARDFDVLELFILSRVNAAAVEAPDCRPRECEDDGGVGGNNELRVLFGHML